MGSSDHTDKKPGITNVEKHESLPDDSLHEFTAAEIGALAHLYRGEVYRSTTWRTRLDNTTNWAVAALGLAMSASFSHAEASPLPLLLIGILIVVFMTFEARRYRYFNVWRARARWLETNFYAPMLRGQGCNPGRGWEQVLAKDYMEPRHHISMARAIGRRLRRTYFWLLTISGVGLPRQDCDPPDASDQRCGVCAARVCRTDSRRGGALEWRDFQWGLARIRAFHVPLRPCGPRQGQARQHGMNQVSASLQSISTSRALQKRQ